MPMAQGSATASPTEAEAEEEEDSDEEDEAGALMSGTEAFAMATCVAEVPFPAKTVFFLDMLSRNSSMSNMSTETVSARRVGLSAWLRAVHRLRPQEVTDRSIVRWLHSTPSTTHNPAPLQKESHWPVHLLTRRACGGGHSLLRTSCRRSSRRISTTPPSCPTSALASR